MAVESITKTADKRRVREKRSVQFEADKSSSIISKEALKDLIGKLNLKQNADKNKDADIKNADVKLWREYEILRRTVKGEEVFLKNGDKYQLEDEEVFDIFKRAVSGKNTKILYDILENDDTIKKMQEYKNSLSREKDNQKKVTLLVQVLRLCKISSAQRYVSFETDFKIIQKAYEIVVKIKETDKKRAPLIKMLKKYFSDKGLPIKYKELKVDKEELDTVADELLEQDYEQGIREENLKATEKKLIEYKQKLNDRENNLDAREYEHQRKLKEFNADKNKLYRRYRRSRQYSKYSENIVKFKFQEKEFKKRKRKLMFETKKFRSDRNKFEEQVRTQQGELLKSQNELKKREEELRRAKEEFNLREKLLDDKELEKAEKIFMFFPSIVPEDSYTLSENEDIMLYSSVPEVNEKEQKQKESEDGFDLFNEKMDAEIPDDNNVQPNKSGVDLFDGREEELSDYPGLENNTASNNSFMQNYPGVGTFSPQRSPASPTSQPSSSPPTWDDTRDSELVL